MKTTIIRLSVLALATAGFSVSALIPQGTSKTEIKPVIAVTGSAPMCKPDGSQGYCGMH